MQVTVDDRDRFSVRSFGPGGTVATASEAVMLVIALACTALVRTDRVR